MAVNTVYRQIPAGDRKNFFPNILPQLWQQGLQLSGTENFFNVI
jgi:hypothetical protein